MTTCLVTDKARSESEGGLEHDDKVFSDRREYALTSGGSGLEGPNKFKKVYTRV